MRPPRGLTPEENALWRRVAETVTPLHPRLVRPAPAATPAPPLKLPEPARKVRGRIPLSPPPPPPTPVPQRPLTSGGLDSTWDRKLTRGTILPELTIDLHGLTLDAAHARLLSALDQASAMGARVVLVIAGRPRPHDEHDARGNRRGAIRAKLIDWLAASRHASQIAAVRNAQPRHGGPGAVYVVLRRS